jgi:hypothetical protein
MSKRGTRTPAPGRLFRMPTSDKVSWLVLLRSDTGREFHVVPCDERGDMVGMTDVAHEAGGRVILVARCAFGMWVPRLALTGPFACGYVPDGFLEVARDKLRECVAANPFGSIRQYATQGRPEYVEYLKELAGLANRAYRWATN